MSMHNLYRNMLAEYYMNAANSTKAIMKSFFNRIPGPDDLTREWILDFLMSYDNKKTRSIYFTLFKVTCKRLGKSELMEGIVVKEPKPDVTRADLLTPKEIAALLKAAQRPMMKATIELLIESGCRIGELLPLMKEDITIETDFLNVTFVGKTGTRHVPLLRENLLHFQYYISTVESGRIFGKSVDTIRRYMVEIFKKVGVRKRTIHCFRHTKATYLVESGVPEAMIRQFMGWANTSKMIAVYAHLSNKSLKDYLARLHGKNIEPLEEFYPEEERRKMVDVLG